MAPITVVNSIKLYVNGKGGAPTHGETALIDSVRGRFNSKYVESDEGDEITVFTHCIEPIVKYLRVAFTNLRWRNLPLEDQGIHVHEVYKLIGARTRFVKRFLSVTDDEEAWQRVTSGIAAMSLGYAVARPKLSGRTSVTSAAPEVVATVESVWYLHKVMVFVYFWVAAYGVFQLRVFVDVGRPRFFSLIAAVVLGAGGPLYLRFGPTRVGRPTLAAPVATEADREDDQKSEAYEGSGAEGDHQGADTTRGEAEPDAPSEGDSGLAAELAQLKSLVAQLAAKSSSAAAPLPAPAPPMPSSGGQHSPEMQTLMDFASNANPSGPISRTAESMAGHRVDSAAPVPLWTPPPGSRHAPEPPSGAVGWAPFVAGSKTAQQAGVILDSLIHWQAQKALNPHWGVHFWHDVAGCEHHDGFEADLKRALQSYGYHGPSTVGAPREGLRNALESLKAVGAPAVGAGLARTASGHVGAPSGESLSTGNRWKGQLPPDLARAGPEIYRSLRHEGFGNVREWLNASFQGQKGSNNAEWVVLWNEATEIDFAVDSFSEHTMMVDIAQSDSLEIKLRHLASYMYQARTGDVTGAAMMMAIRPPGSSTDIAPSWLVNEVTNYSKSEHLRWQRVTQRKGGRGKGGDPEGGDGRGRGRGRGTKEKGDDGKGAGTEGSGGGRGRGRGRGRS